MSGHQSEITESADVDFPIPPVAEIEEVPSDCDGGSRRESSDGTGPAARFRESFNENAVRMSASSKDKTFPLLPPPRAAEMPAKPLKSAVKTPVESEDPFLAFVQAKEEHKKKEAPKVRKIKRASRAKPPKAVQTGNLLELESEGVSREEGTPIFLGPVEDATKDESEEEEEEALFSILVLHEGQEFPVGWRSGLTPADVRDAIAGACDSIWDREGFALLQEDSGALFNHKDFANVQVGAKYRLVASESSSSLPHPVVGDRWRRLKVLVEPLKHAEAQAALRRMQKGANLLKHTRYGYPHLRQFQLSSDMKRLLWYSAAKDKSKSSFSLERVAEIRLGQTSEIFQQYKLPMLEHLSFTLKAEGGEDGGPAALDLTCKDEFEFDAWIAGLKAVVCHWRGGGLSKMDLLNHSRRFKKACDRSEVSVQLSSLPEVKERGQVALEDCVEMARLTKKELKEKASTLIERQKHLRIELRKVSGSEGLGCAAGEGEEIDLALLVEPEGAEDEEMEMGRMLELAKETSEMLETAEKKLDMSEDEENERGRQNRPSRLREAEQLLWKAEIDIENVEDMLARYRAVDPSGHRNLTQVPLPPLLQNLAEEGTRVAENAIQYMNESLLNLWGEKREKPQSAQKALVQKANK